jgi:RNA polymerase sigma-70 factor (ECF subfamily)
MSEWSQGPPADQARPDSDIAARLGIAAMAAREAWPTLSVEPEVFASYLAERLPGDTDPLVAIDNLHVADLYLACACSRGEPAAIESEGYLDINAARLRLRGDEHFAAELRQLLLEKLFVQDGTRTAKILEYSGRGHLKAWLRVVAARAGLNLLRDTKRPFDEDAELADKIAGTNIETEILKGRYRTEFKEAFQEGMAVLSSRERSLLRHYYIDGLTMDDIGAIYRVHRITVVRWMTKSRTVLQGATRRALAARLQLEGDELESIVRLVHNEIDTSLSKYLVD